MDSPQQEPQQPAPPAELNAKDDIRLQVLEKTQDKMFSIVTWGFGTLIALALALVGGNWLSSKMNIERDEKTLADTTELLKNQLTLTKQELLLANNEQLADIRSESASNIDSKFSITEKQLANVFSSLSNSLVNGAAISSLQVNQLVQSNATITAQAITTLGTNFSTMYADINGFTFFQQGFTLCNNNKGDSTQQQVMMFVGIKSYTIAADNFMNCNDEDNLSRSLGNLATAIVPTVDYPPNVIQSSFDGANLNTKLEALIKRVEESPERVSRNEGSLVEIKASIGFLNRKAGK